jgi:hypothetical protein
LDVYQGVRESRIEATRTSKDFVHRPANPKITTPLHQPSPIHRKSRHDNNNNNNKKILHPGRTRPAVVRQNALANKTEKKEQRESKREK